MVPPSTSKLRLMRMPMASLSVLSILWISSL